MKGEIETLDKNWILMKKEEIQARTELKLYEIQCEASVAEAETNLAKKKSCWATELEKMNTLRENEKLLAKATLEYEIKVKEADGDLYQKQRAADAELFSKKKEAEGMLALAASEGTYVRTLLTELGGDYAALRDYVMINGKTYQELAKINAEGLQPKITVNGPSGSSEDGKVTQVRKMLASFIAKVPVPDQTEMQQYSSWNNYGNDHHLVTHQSRGG